MRKTNISFFVTHLNITNLSTSPSKKYWVKSCGNTEIWAINESIRSKNNQYINYAILSGLEMGKIWKAID